jgi:hypothetical protein
VYYRLSLASRGKEGHFGTWPCHPLNTYIILFNIKYYLAEGQYKNSSLQPTNGIGLALPEDRPLHIHACILDFEEKIQHYHFTMTEPERIIEDAIVNSF